MYVQFAIVTNSTIKSEEVQTIASDFKNYLDNNGNSLLGFTVDRANTTIKSIVGQDGKSRFSLTTIFFLIRALPLLSVTINYIELKKVCGLFKN